MGEEVYLEAMILENDSLQEIDDNSSYVSDESMHGALHRGDDDGDSVVHRMFYSSDSDAESPQYPRMTDVTYYGRGWSTDSGEEEDDETETYFDRLLERKRRPSEDRITDGLYATKIETITSGDRAPLVVTGLVLVKDASPLVGRDGHLDGYVSDEICLFDDPFGEGHILKAESPLAPKETAPPPPPPPSFSAATAKLLGLNTPISGAPSLSSISKSPFYRPLSTASTPSVAGEDRKRKASAEVMSPIGMPSKVDGKRVRPSAVPSILHTPSRSSSSILKLDGAKTLQPVKLGSDRSRSESAVALDFRIEDFLVLESDDEATENGILDNQSVLSAPEDNGDPGSPFPLHDKNMFVSLPTTPTMEKRQHFHAGAMTVSSMLNRWSKIPISSFRRSTKRRSSLPSLQAASHAIRADATLVSSSHTRRPSGLIMSPPFPQLIPDPSHIGSNTPTHAWSSSNASSISFGVNGDGGNLGVTNDLPSAVASPIHSPLFKDVVPAAGFPSLILLGDAALPKSPRNHRR